MLINEIDIVMIMLFLGRLNMLPGDVEKSHY